jgi:hypothetical protein
MHRSFYCHLYPLYILWSPASANNNSLCVHIFWPEQRKGFSYCVLQCGRSKVMVRKHTTTVLLASCGYMTVDSKTAMSQNGACT